MRKLVVCFTALVLLAFLCSGCATWKKMAGSSEEEASAPKSEPLNQAFHGFPDVPVPKELSLVENKSFVYETQTMRVGVLMFTGNVDLQSLEEYFKVNMGRNGWKFINSTKYRGISLLFIKEDKTAQIKMNKGTFGSDIEISIGAGTVLNKAEKMPVRKGGAPE